MSSQSRGTILTASAHNATFSEVRAISNNGGVITYNGVTCRMASNVGVVVSVSGSVIAKKVSTYTDGILTSTESNVTLSDFTLIDSNNLLVKVYEF